MNAFTQNTSNANHSIDKQMPKIGKFGGGLPPLGGGSVKNIKGGIVLNALQKSLENINSNIKLAERLTEAQVNDNKTHQSMLRESSQQLVSQSQFSLDKLVELGKMSGLSASVMAATIKGGATLVSQGVDDVLSDMPLEDKNRKQQLIQQARYIKEKLADTIKDLKAQRELSLAESNDESDYHHFSAHN